MHLPTEIISRRGVSLATDRDAGSSPRWAARLGFAAVACSLTCAAGTTWLVIEPLRDRLLPALLAEHRPAPNELVSLALAGMGLVQWAVLGLLAGYGVACVLVEWRYRAVSAVLAGPPRLMLALFLLILLWLGHSYIGSGVLLSGDTIAHVSMLATRADAVRRGQDPTWSNWTYLGLALQSFYAPTTFWPLVRLTLLTGSPTIALRCFLLVAHVSSGLAGYALAREFKLGRLGACFAAIVYAGAFAHLHLILYRGAIPQALSAAIFPLALLFTHRIAAGPRAAIWGGNWIALSLVTGELLANYTPLAIVGGAHMAALALLALRWDSAPARLSALAAAAVAAAMLAAFVLIPAADAGSEVLPLSLGSLLTLSVPTAAYLDHLLVWRAWRTDFPGGAAYLGVVAVGFGCFQIATAFRERRTLTLAGLLALSLVLSGLHVRDVTFTLAYVALLAGLGEQAVLRRFGSARRGVAASAPAIVLLLFLLDLGSTAVQPVGRTDKGWLIAAGSFLAQQVPSTRTLPMEVRDGRIVASAGPSLLDWQPAEFVASGHVEMATRAWIYAEEAGYMVESDLAAAPPHLQPATRELLCLLRVGRIVGVGRTAMGLPASVPDTMPDGPLGRVLAPQCASPVVFAPQLESSTEPPFPAMLDYRPRYGATVLPRFRDHLDRVVGEMAFDPASGQAARILVPNLPATARSTPVTQDERPSVEIASYVVGPARIDLTLSVNSDGYLRLSHAWDRRLVVRRNGTVVATWRDVTGCIVVAVKAGRTSLSIEPGSPGAEFIGLAVTAASLMALGLFAARHRLFGKLRRMKSSTGRTAPADR